MKIVVCVKRVPDTEAAINVDPRTKGLIKRNLKYILNPYDEYAIEEALTIGSQLGGEVIAITLGPPEAADILKTALAMGVDRAIQISDHPVEERDAYSTAYILASAIKPQGFDLILCGKRSLDDDNGQVGVNIAEILSVPNISAVIDVTIRRDEVEAIRMLEGGSEKVSCSLPCVLTCERGLNSPRVPSIRSIIIAKRKAIEKLTLSDIGIGEEDINKFNSRGSFLYYSLPKPRKSKMLQSQMGLSAQERMQIIMSGGVEKKAENRLLWGDEDEVVHEVVHEIDRLLKLDIGSSFSK